MAEGLGDGAEGVEAGGAAELGSRRHVSDSRLASGQEEIRISDLELIEMKGKRKLKVAQ